MKTGTLPRWAPMIGLTLFGRVWIRKGVSDQERQGIIEHESVHLAQQKRDGVWRFHFRYLLFPSWRVRYEVEAYRVDVAAGRESRASAARLISSWLYLRPCSYSQALACLTAPPWGEMQGE